MTSIARTIPIVVLLGFVFSPVATADDKPEWKAGVARIKITPDEPVFLAGYASRNHAYERIETDLFAKALALEDNQGNKGLIITTDLIGLSAAVAEPVCARIRVRTGLKRPQILLNSSHIHTGPQLSLDERPRENLSAADAARTAAYTRRLQEKLVEVAGEALERLRPVRLAWGSGVVDFAMNRREFTPTGVILGVNARGLADRSVPVLQLEGLDGKPTAVLFGTACHNTTLTDKNYEVCGDFAGYAQAYVSEHVAGAEALFMIGCAGDANPYPRGSLDLARAHGVTLGKEVCRVLTTRLRPVHGPLRVALEQVALPLQPAPTRSTLEKQATRRDIQSWVARQILAKLDRGEPLPDHYSCPIAVWQLGDLTLVGLSGEVVVDYVARLEKALGPNNLWIAAYCNDVFGYLPSARVLQEGGYETRGLYSGGVGIFDPKAEDVVIATVRSLAHKVGRAPAQK